MRNLEKSRKDIEKAEKNNQKEVDKWQRKLDTDVKDKKTLEKTAGKIRGEGTLEGLKKVERLGDQASGNVDNQTRRDATDLDSSAHKEAKDREKSLDKRSGETKQDAQDLKGGARELDQKSAVSQMEKAAQEAKDDQKYLDQRHKAQEKIRNKSETDSGKKQKDVNVTKPNFKRY